MSNKAEKELLKGKKQAAEMLSMEEVNTVVLVTDVGTAVLGTTEEICKCICKLIAVLKMKKFDGMDLLRQGILFTFLDEKEQLQFLKNDLKDLLKKIDEKEKEEKEND